MSTSRAIQITLLIVIFGLCAAVVLQATSHVAAKPVAAAPPAISNVLPPIPSVSDFTSKSRLVDQTCDSAVDFASGDFETEVLYTGKQAVGSFLITYRASGPGVETTTQSTRFDLAGLNVSPSTGLPVVDDGYVSETVCNAAAPTVTIVSVTR